MAATTEQIIAQLRELDYAVGLDSKEARRAHEAYESDLVDADYVATKEGHAQESWDAWWAALREHGISHHQAKQALRGG